MKKRISLLLAILMILSCFVGTGITASAAAVIEIDSASEFLKIGSDSAYPLSGSYKLTVDLDFSGTTWKPISGVFSGILDGDGHAISGMTSGTSDAPYTNAKGWGIFNELSGTVKNLKIENIYFNVSSDNKPVGGICGYICAGAVVENVYMSGSVTDVSSRQVRIGAIAGSARGAFTLRNLLINVNVTGGYGATDGDKQVGIAGLVGSTKQGGTISDCLYIGSVSLTTRGYAGALVSEYYGNTVENTGLTVTNSYFVGSVTYPKGSFINDGVGAVIASSKLLDGTLSGKLSDAWTVESESIPYLNSFGPENDIVLPPESEDGTIMIRTAAELRKIGVDANYPISGKYKLVADIDFSGTTWTPISGVFSGVLDGDGHTISGMTSGAPDAPCTNAKGWGIFNELSGTVKNLKIENVYFNVASDNKPAGVICGYICKGAVVENVYISGSLIDVASRQVRLGAVAGSARDKFTVKNCFIDVDITGGFGDVEGDKQAGVAAIIGSTRVSGVISDCISVGKITLTTRGYLGAIASDYYGYFADEGEFVVTNTYYASELVYANGSLHYIDFGTNVTAEQLVNGYLSDKLSAAWTVSDGEIPYLTTLGRNEITVNDAAEKVDAALGSFLANVGTTANDILSCVLKTVTGTAASVSIESFDFERPTNSKEGMVAVTVKVTVDGESKTVSHNYTLKKIPALVYEFTSSVKGRADGVISILLPYEYNDEAYELYFGTADGVSKKYSSLTTMQDISVNGYVLTYIPESQSYIPTDVTHLHLTLNGKVIDSVEIPEERRMTLGTPKYSFGIFSDVHFSASAGTANKSFTAAMDIYEALGVKFVVASGDLTSGGRASEYEQLLSAYAAGGYKMPIWTTLGNHDILKWNLDSALSPVQALQNHKDAFPNHANVNHGAGDDYTVTVSDGAGAEYDYTMSYGDDIFIFMGVGVASNSSTNASGNLVNVDQKLADSQLEWLESTLNNYYNVEKKDGQVFLIFHYYTLESGKYYSTATGTEWNTESSAALDALLREYPGVIHFNGHNHFYFDVDMNMYAEEYVSIHVPSLTNPRPSRDGTEGTGNAYESYVVTVYEDYILVNGVDAYTGTYVPHAMFMISDDSFTGLVKEPEEPKIESFNLNLNRGITVNVKFTVSAEYLAKYPNTKIVFSNGVEFDAVAGTNTYSVELTPAEIGSALTVVCGENGNEYDVSVATYVAKAKAAYSQSAYPELWTLLDAIEAYGKAANGTLDSVAAPDFTGVGTIEKTGDIFVGLGATLSGSASAKLTVDESKLNDSYKVTVTFGDTVLVNGKPVMDYVENGAISITGIYAANYNEEITVTVYNGSEAVASVSFTFNEYLSALYENTTNAKNKTLIGATYNYGAAAFAFAS